MKNNLNLNTSGEEKKFKSYLKVFYFVASCFVLIGLVLFIFLLISKTEPIIKFGVGLCLLSSFFLLGYVSGKISNVFKVIDECLEVVDECLDKQAKEIQELKKLIGKEK